MHKNKSNLYIDLLNYINNEIILFSFLFFALLLYLLLIFISVVQVVMMMMMAVAVGGGREKIKKVIEYIWLCSIQNDRHHDLVLFIFTFMNYFIDLIFLDACYYYYDDDDNDYYNIYGTTYFSSAGENIEKKEKNNMTSYSFMYLYITVLFNCFTHLVFLRVRVRVCVSVCVFSC